MKRTLAELDIEAKNGKFFRKKIRRASNGEHFVIQLRDIEKDKRGSWLNLSKVVKTNIKTKGQLDYLQKGDVLIAIKGIKKHGFLLDKVPIHTVASQHFLILRSPDTKKILPEFIEYIVNSPESQRWFSRKCSGSYQSTLSRETLEKMPFPNVAFEEQQKIVALIREARAEKNLLLDLIENREKQVKAYATKIIKAGH